MKRLWPIAAGIAAGLLVGVVWTWAQPDRYRADARLLVRGTEPARVMPAAEALAESSLVAQNVAQTLRTNEPPDVSAEREKGGVLRVSVEAGSAERARQLDAEAVIILIQTIPRRFEATPGIDATVLDPAHVAQQTSPTPERNFLVAGLGGLAVGIALAFALRERRAPPVAAGAAADASGERRLQARIDQVAKRERALARRAGQLAAREHRLERRERELAKSEAPREAVASEAEQQPEPEPEPEQREPEPEPQAQPAPATVPGEWNLVTLERLVRERGSADTAEREQWTTYLFFLRDHAAPDGTLPSSFEPLLNEVFGGLVSAPAPEAPRDLRGESRQPRGGVDAEQPPRQL